MGGNGKGRPGAAGPANLAKWKEKNPSGGNLKHGLYSGNVRRRYADKRTREGKELAAIMRSMVEDLGGEPSAAQSVLLGSIRAKLVILLQVARHVDQQEGVLTKDGGLLPVLRWGFGSYSEGLRRDLLALAALGARQSAKVPRLAEILAGKRR